MTESGACDWDRLRALLPREKLDRIASIQPPQRESEAGVMEDILVHGNKLVVECCRVPNVVKGAHVGQALAQHWVRPSSSMDPTIFNLAPADIGNLVEEEQQSFSPVTAMPLLEEPEVSFDPGGIG
ncbi:hypothetical protein V6N12_068706 [Hibiscus sabdariffa]|uniref:Uncharacterized protein n=1 Tax=Hibiscus sabdariffa TaxID=183260 RepID=A0ABR2FQW4_9ROSI